MMPIGDRARGQSGFTLIELLIALVLGVTIISVGTAALIWSLETTGRTSDSIEGSARSHIATSWFLTDVQSAEEVRSVPSCDDTGVSEDDPEWLGGFAWGLSDDPSTTVASDWWLSPEEDGGSGDEIIWRVVRVMCDSGGATTFGPHPILRAIEPGATGIDCPDDTCTLEWAPNQASGEPSELTVARRVSP